MQMQRRTGSNNCPVHKKEFDENYWFEKNENETKVDEENQDEE